jgi:hypothetical protein
MVAACLFVSAAPGGGAPGGMGYGEGCERGKNKRRKREILGKK